MLFDLEELLGRLSAEEQAALDSLNALTLIPFCATVTADGQDETVNVLAPDACSAVTKVMEMLFGDFSTVKPKALKIKIEAIKDYGQR